MFAHALEPKVLGLFFHLTNHCCCTARFSSEILTLFPTKTQKSYVSTLEFIQRVILQLFRFTHSSALNPEKIFAFF